MEEAYETAQVELTLVTNKLEKSYTDKNIIQRSKTQIVSHFKFMSTADKVEKVGGAVNSVVGAIAKFQSGDTLEIVSGSLDITTAILDFAPPPFSIVAGKLVHTPCI